MTNERRKAELKAKIEAAATAVFLRKGYAETKIIDIANEAQISPSTIYLYFDGKKQLFASLNIPEVAQLRPEYDRRREEITRVALTLFGERGFEGTTMDDIAEEMGFSKAALYQYCASKEDLFFQVLQLYTHATPPTASMVGADSGDWRQLVRNIAATYMEIAHDPHRNAFLGSVMRDSNKFPEFGTVYYEKSFCTARRNMVTSLTPFQQKGEIRQDLNLNAAVTAFFGALTSHTLLYSVVKGVPCDVPEADFVSAEVDIFIRGIEARPKEP
ncbi:MAG: helix-turn-helix transcriptional regulator [Oscillospiraceae bacterium]|nr:helix-turn-helix transcriptional regulator [Oscillospiraceae bacterium]